MFDDRVADRGRGETSVVGIVLLIGVAIVVAMVLGVYVLDFAEGLGGPTAETKVDFEQTSAGLAIRPQVIGQEVDVRVNGDVVLTLDGDDAGQTTTLPTAPGDRVVVVAGDSDRKILLDERFDTGEAGDFIAYYPMDGSGSTLVDRSSNDNDGTISGATRIDTADGDGLRFDGTNDYATVTSLTAGRDVKAFTVAARYRVTGDTGGVQQLVEHHVGGSGVEWFLETDGSMPYHVDYAVNFPTDVISTSDTYGTGETHVVVGTYDQRTGTYRLYVDGTLVDSGSYDSTVEMGDLVIGADAPGHNFQYLDGELYELRLYYTAFGERDVETLTRAMQAEAD